MNTVERYHAEVARAEARRRQERRTAIWHDLAASACLAAFIGIVTFFSLVV